MNSSLKILLGVAICGFGYVQAGTRYWANGGNEQGRWYDANKSYAVENDGDDMMSYAASNSNGENGGDAGWAMAWWIGVVYSPTTSDEANLGFLHTSCFLTTLS